MTCFDDIVTDRRLSKASVETFIGDPTNLGSLHLDRFAICHTSGSQGQPAIIVQDAAAMMTNFAVQFVRGTKLKHKWLPHVDRLWKPARMAILTQQPGFYPSGAAFSYLPAILHRFMKIERLSVFDPVADNVARLNAFKPEFLTGYTSSLEILAREQEEGRLRLRETGSLRQINNISEPLPEKSRKRIEAAFGVPLFDQYAMAECLALTCGCPTEGGSHLNLDLGVLEIVDSNNMPVPAGEPGSKVLLTNLYNYTQPLIRYEIDDIVAIAPENGAARCSCGSSFPRIGSIEGRSKDKFWIKDGSSSRELPSYLFLAGLHHYLDIDEHQVLQTGLNQFVVRAAAREGKVLDQERVRRLVHESVALEGLNKILEFKIEIVDQIPRGPSGKVNRAQNLYGPPEVPL